MSLSSTDDAQIRKDWERLVTSADDCVVRVMCRERGPFLLPQDDGNIEVVAVFRPMSFGEYRQMELEASVEEQVSEREALLTVDYETMKESILRRMLVSWNLDVPLEFNERGWLTDDCFERICRFPAPLIEALLDEYESKLMISDEEEQKIDRQAAILFAKNSKGVSNACEAVSLFCTYSNFWEKFGLNRFQLAQLPYAEFLRLRIMVGKDNQAHAAAMRSSDKPRAKVVGPGGRPRASRGVVVPG